MDGMGDPIVRHTQVADADDVDDGCHWEVDSTSSWYNWQDNPTNFENVRHFDAKLGWRRNMSSPSSKIFCIQAGFFQNPRPVVIYVAWMQWCRSNIITGNLCILHIGYRKGCHLPELRDCGKPLRQPTCKRSPSFWKRWQQLGSPTMRLTRRRKHQLGVLTVGWRL